MAVVAALWPATAYGAALVRVLGRVAGNREASGRRGRGAALVLVFIVPVLVLGSLAAGYDRTPALGDTAAVVAIGLAFTLMRRPSSSGLPADAARLASDTAWSARRRWRHHLAVGGLRRLPAPWRQLQHRHTSDALAAVVPLAVSLFAVNTALLLGYRVARRQTRRSQALLDAWLIRRVQAQLRGRSRG